MGSDWSRLRDRCRGGVGFYPHQPPSTNSLAHPTSHLKRQLPTRAPSHIIHLHPPFLPLLPLRGARCKLPPVSHPRRSVQADLFIAEVGVEGCGVSHPHLRVRNESMIALAGGAFPFLRSHHMASVLPVPA